MRLVVTLLLMSLLTTSTWAGTFRDDFEDGNLSGWELYPVDKSPKFQVEKGEACVQTHSWIRDGIPYYCVGTMAIGSSDWRNYTLELSVKTVESDHGKGHAIVIGIRAEDIPSEPPFSATIEYSGVYMRIVSDRIFGVITVYKVIKIDPPIVHKEMINVNGKLIPYTWKETHRWEQIFQDGVKWAIAFDTWYPVKMVAKDNHFKLYFNNELVTTFDDANIMSGKVRLFAANAHVHFDDVVITGKNIPDIGPSGMLVSVKGKVATTWGNIKR